MTRLGLQAKARQRYAITGLFPVQCDFIANFDRIHVGAYDIRHESRVVQFGKDDERNHVR